ncbi:hypothetical protein AB0M03_39585, partial [Kitasatospora sp. NPDC051914]
TGTFVSMVQASEFVRVIEERQGFKIGCIEEACWRAGLIDGAQLRALAEPLLKSGYGQYLLDLLQEEPHEDGPRMRQHVENTELRPDGIHVQDPFWLDWRRVSRADASPGDPPRTGRLDAPPGPGPDRDALPTRRRSGPRDQQARRGGQPSGRDVP